MINIICKKYLLAPLLFFALSASQVSLAEDVNLLNGMLTERISANAKYTIKFVNEAEDLTLAEDIIPLEKKLGKEWGEYLTYVRTHKDLELKKRVLKLEYLDELTGEYHDLEYAEGKLEKLAIRSRITEWKKKLAALDKIKTEAKPSAEITPKK